MYGDWFVALMPNLLVAAFSIALGYFAWRDSSRPYRRYFAFMVWFTAALAILLIAEKTIDSLSIVQSLCVIEYILEMLVILSLFQFVMEYSGRKEYAKTKMMLLLTAFGSISPILLATNQWHHLFYVSSKLNHLDGFVIIEPEYGPGIAIWVMFSMGLLGFCCFMLMASYLHAPKKDKRGYAIITSAIVWMIGSTVVYWLSSKQNPLLDILALGLFGGVLIVYYGAFWHSLLDAPPFTILQLLENVYDGAVLVDENGKMAYWNAAARHVLTDERGEPLPMSEWYRKEPEYELVLNRNGKQIVWNVKGSVVQDGGRMTGTVIVLSDITEKREMAKALEQSNRLLSIMQSVNRHDLRNDAIALSGYLELMGQNGHKDDARLAQARKVLAQMMERIEQVKDIPVPELKNEAWERVGDGVRVAVKQLDLNGIDLDVQLSGLEVRSDQMMERIFYNLVDNSIRHGGRVSRISITYQERGDDCAIIVEDDGRGIPAEKKELIFQRGYGDNTGMGLYLAREIVRALGMTMIENGQSGARFELVLPRSRWRTA